MHGAVPRGEEVEEVYWTHSSSLHDQRGYNFVLRKEGGVLRMYWYMIAIRTRDQQVIEAKDLDPL